MYPLIKIWKISTSKIELRDLAKAWLVISLAFAISFSGISLLDGNFTLDKIISLAFLRMFIIILFSAGIGFLLHEMAHKFVAQRYGCLAEFRAFDQFLWLALGLAVFLGTTFAAPGAVMIVGQITRKENGWISFAGPLTNYVLAGLFFGLTLLFPFTSTLYVIGAMGYQINLWLGLFNMIPFGNFDGIKIYHWNIPVWVGMVAVGILLLFVLPYLI